MITEEQSINTIINGVRDGSFFSVLFQLQKGKTCADDMLVAVMLHQLDDDIWDLLATVFEMRILNHVSESDDAAWELQMVNLLRKKSIPKTVKDFRPIAIMPVLQKLYSRVLLILSCNLRISSRFEPSKL